jgi:hypothetical protein
VYLRNLIIRFSVLRKRKAAWEALEYRVPQSVDLQSYWIKWRTAMGKANKRAAIKSRLAFSFQDKKGPSSRTRNSKVTPNA